MVETLKDQVNGMINALWANSSFNESNELMDARTQQIELLTKKLNDFTEYIYNGTGAMAEEDKSEEEVFDSPFFKNSFKNSQGSDKIDYNKSTNFPMPEVEVED